MVYTVTLNPALDYSIFSESAVQGAINSFSKSEIFPGGKGVNVSIMLKNFGIKSIGIGFVAGFSGDYIKESLKKSGIETDFVHLKSGMSRINVKIRSAGIETDFNGAGPDIGEEDVSEILSKVDKFKDGDVLVLAGKTPCSTDIYAQILKRTADKQILTAVDARGEALLNTLKYRPFLIKPNHQELGELFDVKITKLSQAREYAKKLVEMGAQNVVVSFGKKGALLVWDSPQALFCKAPQGEVISTVGAGDSLVAGCIYAFLTGQSREEALRWGVAAGSATAFSISIAKSSAVSELRGRVSAPELLE